MIGQEETVFDKPMTPAEIQSVMYSTIQPHNIIQAVLQQEVLLYCGRLIGTNPEMFKGILKIRVGYGEKYSTFKLRRLSITHADSFTCRWVLEAVKLYVEMFGKNPKPIENYSPYEVRRFLIKVLTIKDWAASKK